MHRSVYTKSQNIILAIFFWFSGFNNYSEYLLFRSLSPKKLSNLNFNFNKNLAYLSVALEAKFKGYKKLKSKNFRYKIYQQLDFLSGDFLAFSEESTQDNIFEVINTYFKTRFKYSYKEGSSFFNLVEKAENFLLEGDCNQMTTLYLHLYSLKYDLKQVKLLETKNHVAIFYNQKVVETTNQTFKNLSEYNDPKIVNSKEILTINLLDTHDLREKSVKIKASEFFNAYKLAKKISKNNQFVEQNYRVGLHNLGLSFLKKNNFKKAIFYIKQLNENTIENYLYEKATRYYIDKNLPFKAKFWAEKIINPENKLGYLKIVGNKFIESGKDGMAKQIFKKIKDKDGLKRLKAKKLNNLIKRYNTNLNKNINSQKPLIRKIVKLAKEVGDDELALRLSKLI